jgi:hypothetical protein
MLALINIARGSNRAMGGIALKNLNLCSKIVFHDWVLVPQGYFHNSVSTTSTKSSWFGSKSQGHELELLGFNTTIGETCQQSSSHKVVNLHKTEIQ